MTLWFPIEPLSKKMAAKSQPSYFFNLSNLASQLILATLPRTTGSRTIISWGRRSQSWTLEEKMGRVFPASHQFQTRSAGTQTFLDSSLFQRETLLQKDMKHQFSAVMVQNELLYHHNWGFSSGSWSSWLSKLIKKLHTLRFQWSNPQVLNHFLHLWWIDLCPDVCAKYWFHGNGQNKSKPLEFSLSFPYKTVSLVNPSATQHLVTGQHET